MSEREQHPAGTGHQTPEQANKIIPDSAQTNQPKPLTKGQIYKLLKSIEDVAIERVLLGLPDYVDIDTLTVINVQLWVKAAARAVNDDLRVDQ